jgi:hypothetical protein
MKKTLNAFIKQSPQLKKGETFIDNNPQARSNPYEPEMSIREGRATRVANVAADTGGMALGSSTGDIAVPAAIEAGARKAGMTKTANVARFVGQADTINAIGKAANRGIAKVAPRLATGAVGTVAKGVLGKAAWPVALGMGVVDAYKGYNAQPNAPVSRKWRNAGQNVLAGLTFDQLVKPPKGIDEMTHGDRKMKTLHQFMAEAIETLPEDEQVQENIITEDDIIDSIVEALDGEQVTEEEFVELYNRVVEQLSSEEILDEEELAEEHDIELKPHSNGTHYIVHKINPNSGIKSDQLKSGETINDSHVDDLRDMDYKVKIHSGKKLNENIEDEHSEAYGDHEELISQVKDSSAKKKFAKEFEKHASNFSHHYDNEDDDQAEHALDNMHEVNDRIRAHLKK